MYNTVNNNTTALNAVAQQLCEDAQLAHNYIRTAVNAVQCVCICTAKQCCANTVKQQLNMLFTTNSFSYLYEDKAHVAANGDMCLAANLYCAQHVQLAQQRVNIAIAVVNKALSNTALANANTAYAAALRNAQLYLQQMLQLLSVF